MKMLAPSSVNLFSRTIMQAETLVETDENTDKPAVFRSFFEEAEEVQKLIALLPTTCEQKELPRLNTLCLDIAKIVSH